MARMLRLIAALLARGRARPPAAAHAAGPPATRAALASQMRFAGGGSGALAVDLDSGRHDLRRRAPDAPRIPASVEQALHDRHGAPALYGADGHADAPSVLGDVAVGPGRRARSATSTCAAAATRRFGARRGSTGSPTQLVLDDGG